MDDAEDALAWNILKIGLERSMSPDRSYYLFLDDVPAVAVVALLLYVGCYQVIKNFNPSKILSF